MADALTVVRAICEEFGGRSRDVLCTHRGRPEAARLRRFSMFVYYNQPGQSLSSVGRAFVRDRTTVRHALDRTAAELAADPSLAPRLKRVRDTVFQD